MLSMILFFRDGGSAGPMAGGANEAAIFEVIGIIGCGGGGM